MEHFTCAKSIENLLFSTGKAWKVTKSNLFLVKPSFSCAHKRGCLDKFAAVANHTRPWKFSSFDWNRSFAGRQSTLSMVFLIRRRTHSNTNSNTQTNINAVPVTTASIPYIRGISETIARNYYNLTRSNTATARPLTLLRPAETLARDWRELVMSTIILVNTINRRNIKATCITRPTDCHQRITSESWFTNLEQTPMNRSQQ